MFELKTFLKTMNKNITIKSSRISSYPICYTTDLMANLPPNKFGYKTISSSGNDASKKVSLEKALMELVERIVFIREMEKTYVPAMGKVSSKGWACHFISEKAKEQAELEFYEDYCLEYFNQPLQHSFVVKEVEPRDNLFNFFLVNLGTLFFAASWFYKDKNYALGSACAITSAEAYKKSLQEAYAKFQVGCFESCKDKNIIFQSGYYEKNIVLPCPKVEEVKDEILEKLKLHVFRAV